MEETVGSVCVLSCANSANPHQYLRPRPFCGENSVEKLSGGWKEGMQSENKIGGERERLCWESRWVGSEGGSEREDWGWEGKKEDAQTNASLGNRCNQLSQSAND